MLNWKEVGHGSRRMMEVMNLIFANHPDLLLYLFDIAQPKLRQDPDWLIEESSGMGSGERVLVVLALDLWRGTSRVGLWDLIEKLDRGNYENALAGLRRLREIDEDGPELFFRQLKFPTPSQRRH